MLVRLAEVPQPGLVVEIQPKGRKEFQRYELLRTEPYQRKDGTTSQVLVWRGECRVCGAPFETFGALGKWPEARTCPEHRAKSYAERQREAGE